MVRSDIPGSSKKSNRKPRRKIPTDHPEMQVVEDEQILAPDGSAESQEPDLVDEDTANDEVAVETVAVAPAQQIEVVVEVPQVKSQAKAPGNNNNSNSNNNQNELVVRLSSALLRRIRLQAQDEGISLEELITEFLSESVTLRAFEIIERKAQMKGGNQSAPRQNQQQSQRRNNNNGNNNNKGGGRMSQGRYQNIMDDKANFLEYVRTQERNRR